MSFLRKVISKPIPFINLLSRFHLVWVSRSAIIFAECSRLRSLIRLAKHLSVVSRQFQQIKSIRKVGGFERPLPLSLWWGYIPIILLVNFNQNLSLWRFIRPSESVLPPKPNLFFRFLTLHLSFSTITTSDFLLVPSLSESTQQVFPMWLVHNLHIDKHYFYFRFEVILTSVVARWRKNVLLT